MGRDNMQGGDQAGWCQRTVPKNSLHLFSLGLQGLNKKKVYPELEPFRLALRTWSAYVFKKV